MTSQAWLDASLVDRFIWTHLLVVIVPDNLRYNGTALLLVTGGCRPVALQPGKLEHAAPSPTHPPSMCVHTGGYNTDGPPSGDHGDLNLTATIAVENGVLGTSTGWWVTAFSGGAVCRGLRLHALLSPHTRTLVLVPSCCVHHLLTRPAHPHPARFAAATLFQVPNAPIVFANDPTHQKRVEDGIIAFTFVSFIANQSDPHQVCVWGV